MASPHEDARFASCSACGTLHGNGNLLQLPLHIANGNASLTNEDKYDILTPKEGCVDMPHGYKREYNDVFYFRKDHFCPNCKTKLEKVPVSKVVNSRSPEAKDFDFSMCGGNFAVGDIQFTWDEFECPNCKKHLTVSEMKEIEGIPLPKKPTKWGKFLYYIFGILFIIAIALIKKYLC